MLRWFKYHNKLSSFTQLRIIFHKIHNKLNFLHSIIFKFYYLLSHLRINCELFHFLHLSNHNFFKLDISFTLIRYCSIWFRIRCKYKKSSWSDNFSFIFPCSNQVCRRGWCILLYYTCIQCTFAYKTFLRLENIKIFYLENTIFQLTVKNCNS